MKPLYLLNTVLFIGLRKNMRNLKTFLALNPAAWDVEPNSGGIRKIRWTSGGRGKVVVSESSTLIV